MSISAQSSKRVSSYVANRKENMMPQNYQMDEVPMTVVAALLSVVGRTVPELTLIQPDAPAHFFARVKYYLDVIVGDPIVLLHEEQAIRHLYAGHVQSRGS